jgi:hypothetical protein
MTKTTSYPNQDLQTRMYTAICGKEVSLASEGWEAVGEGRKLLKENGDYA